jgi:hypothetical protein
VTYSAGIFIDEVPTGRFFRNVFVAFVVLFAYWAPMAYRDLPPRVAFAGDLYWLSAEFRALGPLGPKHIRVPLPGSSSVVVKTEEVGSVDWVAHDLSEFRARLWTFSVLVAWMTATYATLLWVSYIDPYRSWVIFGNRIYLCDISDALAELPDDFRDAAQRLNAFVHAALAWCMSKQPTATEAAVQVRQTPSAPAPITVPLAAEEFDEPALIIEAPPPPPRPTEISAETRSTYLNLLGLRPGARLPPDIEAGLLEIEVKNWRAKHWVPPEPWKPTPKGK